MTGWCIVCDVGGTNIRYARCEDGRQVRHAEACPLDEIVDLTTALRTYAARFNDFDALSGVAIAAAGPVDDRTVSLTNRNLTINADDVSQAFDGRPVVLKNDLEAVALSLPWLQASDFGSVFSVARPLSGPRLVVNIGSGFGGALLINTTSGWHALPCEPGHMKLASRLSSPCGPRNVLNTYAIEDIVSGKTLNDPVRMARLWDLDAAAISFEASGDVFEQSAKRAGDRPFIAQFSALLGQVCGDLVLACSAWGGVYLCGSVASAWRKQADVSAFRQAFFDKGLMTARMERVPVLEITAEFPALIGLGTTELK